MQKPLFDNIIVELIESANEKVVNGIIIPDNIDNSKPYAKGKIAAIGPGHYEGGIHIPVSVEVGAIVTFNKYGQAYEFNEGDTKYMFMSERNIFTILEE